MAERGRAVVRERRVKSGRRESAVRSNFSVQSPHHRDTESTEKNGVEENLPFSVISASLWLPWFLVAALPSP